MLLSHVISDLNVICTMIKVIIETGLADFSSAESARQMWVVSRWCDSRRPETQFPDGAARGDLAGSLVNEHIRCRRPRRKIWHRERSQPASGLRPRTPNVALARENSGQPLRVRGSFSMAAFHS